MFRNLQIVGLGMFSCLSELLAGVGRKSRTALKNAHCLWMMGYWETCRCAFDGIWLVSPFLKDLSCGISFFSPKSSG